MTTDDLVKFCGSPQKVQKRFAISRQLFHYWKTHGIPHGRQAEIQIKTRGRVRADSDAAR